jgi:outer membrane lipoprotein-sorting protein
MTAKALVVCVAAAAFAVAQSNNDQPSSARGQGQPPQPQATAELGQPDALDLLRNVAETYGSMATLRAEANTVTEMSGPAMQNKMEGPMTLTLGSQGKMRMESKGAMGMLMVSDGKTVWMYMPHLNKYTKVSSLSAGLGFAGEGALGFGGLGAYGNVIANVKEAKVLRSETLHANGAGVPCWVVSVEYEGAGAEAAPQAAGGVLPTQVDSRTTTLWVDKSHSLVYKEISNTKMTLPRTISPTETKHTVTFKDITVDEPVPDDTFVFTPPEGATEMDLSSFMPQSSPPNK